MGDNSTIEWTDATWNPIVGCSRVSPGCDNCYAERQTATRLKNVPVYAGLTGPDGKWTGEVRFLPERLDQPLHWRRPRRIFVNSMSDLFQPGVDDLQLAEILAVMGLASHHQFQVLTKRPKTMAAVLSDPDGELRYKIALVRKRRHVDGPPPPWPLPNVWWGTSIESQAYAFRARHLMETPAAVRFISAEPLLGPLNLLDALTARRTDGGRIDWLIVGGESGHGARPMHPQWARDLRDLCLAAGVAFLFKQVGEWAWRGSHSNDPYRDVPQDRRWGFVETTGSTRGLAFGSLTNGLGACAGTEVVEKVGKHAAGRMLDGRTWDEYPKVAA